MLNIQKLAEKNDLRKIVDALQNEKAAIRAEAARAIGMKAISLRSRAQIERAKLPGPESVGQMGFYEQNLFASMAHMTDHELEKLRNLALEPLIRNLKDGDGDVRMCAAFSLEMLADPRAVSPLKPLCQDPSWPVRIEAQLALHELLKPRTDKLVQCHKWQFWVQLAKRDGLIVCESHGMEDRCVQASCKYIQAKEFPLSSSPALTDYISEEQIDLPDVDPQYSVRPGKVCDICSQLTIGEMFLLPTDIVVASDRYADLVIEGWVKKGLAPAPGHGRSKSMAREMARASLRVQAGSTPWRVCGSCLPIFALDRLARQQAQLAWSQFINDKGLSGNKNSQEAEGDALRQ